MSDHAPALTEFRDAFLVRGGYSLHGEVHVSGAKNSALKLMAAALLARGETIVGNVPHIADVAVMGEVLAGLGAEVDLRPDGTVVIGVDEPSWHAPRSFVTQMRASIAVLGPLVSRVGRARVALPGGDHIGARPIDLHLRGLVEMGAEVIEDGDEVEVRSDELHGANLTLDFPSVGATENLIMAAVLACGRTVIDNAAREPEIADLCTMLVAMGARIEGVGTSTLTVEGVRELGAVRHDAIPDRIEAGTYAIAAALTGGDVTIRSLRPEHLKLPIAKLAAAGSIVEVGNDSLRVKGDELRAVDVVTLPYPGFPTDLQPQLMVLLSQSRGTSIVTENVFESRFTFIPELARLGAEIVVDGHHAVIRGPRRLRGGIVRSLDVRAGAACLLAGLIAEGQTCVVDVHHIDRGYAHIGERLRTLGAHIERVDPKDGTANSTGASI